MHACLRLALLALLLLASLYAQAKDRPAVVVPLAPVPAPQVFALPQAQPSDVLQLPHSPAVARDSTNDVELRRLARQRRFWQVQALVAFSFTMAAGQVLIAGFELEWIYLTEAQLIVAASAFVGFALLLITSLIVLLVLGGRIRRVLANPDKAKREHLILRRMKRWIHVVLILSGSIAVVAIAIGLSYNYMIAGAVALGVVACALLVLAILLDIQYHKRRLAMQPPAL